MVTSVTAFLFLERTECRSHSVPAECSGFGDGAASINKMKDLLSAGDPSLEAYPADGPSRDLWILRRRSGLARDVLDPRRAAGWVAEVEPNAGGTLEPGLTVFVTNRECPWRCLMCDLWRHTLTERVAQGDVPFQIQTAFREAGDAYRNARWVKLYNAGSFFDPGAIPLADQSIIAQSMHGLERVTLENHPTLTDARILPFRDRLGSVGLEMAMGLETAHPGVLARLNKRVDLDGFRRAAEFLRNQHVALRVFVLVKPPFLEETEALEWACRSLDFAFDYGAAVVTLIPTRFGNGALEALAAQGQFSPPRLETVEAAFRYGLSLRRGRVFVDLWELERSVSNPEVLPVRKTSLQAMNQAQAINPAEE